MGSSKDVVKKEKKERKEEKVKKEKKRSETDGISKEKKDKKKEKAKQDKIARLVDSQILNEAATQAAAPEPVDTSADPEDSITTADNLVPFAIPLADDKVHKKIYKLIKKGAKLKSIHRGVKECEKAIKKAPLSKGGKSSSSDVPGLVIIAGDISPMDVILHFPILCEEHGVPYLYVRSRADLGVAACTKRATSVVMLKPEGKKPSASGSSSKKEKKNEDADMEGTGEDKKVSPEEYLESWKELVKIAQKQWTAQVEPWVKGIHPLQIAAATGGR